MRPSLTRFCTGLLLQRAVARPTALHQWDFMFNSVGPTGNGRAPPEQRPAALYHIWRYTDIVFLSAP